MIIRTGNTLVCDLIKMLRGSGSGTSEESWHLLNSKVKRRAYNKHVTYTLIMREIVHLHIYR